MSALVALWLGTFAAAVSIPPMLSSFDETSRTVFAAVAAVAWIVFAFKISNVTVYSGGTPFQESHLSVALVGVIAALVMIVFLLNSSFDTLTGKISK